MYYYIFESSLEAKEYERTTQIKEYLSSLGIAGEMTSPSPSRNVEDLVELAVGKRYSTIVAVGGMNLINQVARALEPYSIVFGIIPLNDNLDIGNLIGVTDWKSAVDALKKRRLQSIQQGIINDTICFLTPATVQLSNDQSYSVTTPDFSLSGFGGTISISPGRSIEEKSTDLYLEITKPEKASPGILSFLKKKSSTIEKSSLAVSSLTLETSSPEPVCIAGETFLETPIICTTQEKAIKLIVAKGGLAS